MNDWNDIISTTASQRSDGDLHRDKRRKMERGNGYEHVRVCTRHHQIDSDDPKRSNNISHVNSMYSLFLTAPLCPTGPGGRLIVDSTLSL